MIGVDCIGSCKIQLPYDHHHDVTEVVKWKTDNKMHKEKKREPLSIKL